MTQITLYVHSSKEQSWEAGKKAGLTGEALEIFKYAGYEHKMVYGVNEATGEAVLIEVDGRKLR